MNRTDINHSSEVVLVPLLSQIFEYLHLTNLNSTEHVNYPGIDLGDAVARVAFQITSTSNSEKVKETLTKFVKYELYKKYDRLIIYNLTEKQDSYSGKGFEEIIQNTFQFNKDRDIIDYRDLLKVISTFQVDKAQEIQRILEDNFGKSDFSLFEVQDQALLKAASADRRKELLSEYLRRIEGQVSKIRILGDPKLHALSEVFVELTVLRDRERPSSQTQAEYWEMLNSELRERRNPLATSFYAQNKQSWTDRRKVQPEDLLKAGTRAVIAGAPGAGKTTLLKYLVLKTIHGGERLPVFIELKLVSAADVAAAKGNLAELVFVKAFPETVYETEADLVGLREEFYRKLKAGSIAIFLDGLDEVSGTDFFHDLRGSVKDFLGRPDYSDNCLFVSTRPYALLDHFGPEEAQVMEIAPLGQEQIDQFIGHYFGDDPTAAGFLGELRQRPDMRELASVPALLGFLLILYRNHGRAPDDRVELYRELVQKLDGEWDLVKLARREFITLPARRISFLNYLAFARLFGESGRSLPHRFIFTGEEIFKHAERYCEQKAIPDDAAVLAKEVTATALLREVGTDAYAFAHLTLQEYMAATALAERNDLMQIFCRAYFDLMISEMEVLPMALGKTEHQLELHEALGELPESLDHKKLRLQARSLAYGHAPDHLLDELGNRLDELVAVEGQIEYGYFDAVVKAYGAASGRAGEAIARRIAGRLGEDQPEYVRSRAVQAWSIIGNETATGFLRQALKDNDSSVQIEAASALGVKDEEAALEVFANELQSSEDNEVKDKVIYALWNLGTERAAVALEDAAEKYPAARKKALEALTDLRGEAAVPILTNYLSDPDEWVRRTAVESLGEIGGEVVVPGLLGAVDDEKDDVAEKAVRLLGLIGGDDVIQHLMDFLENRSGKIIGAVAEALGHARAVGAITKLVQLLEEYKDEETDEEIPNYFLVGWVNGHVRVRVAGALCQLGDEQGRAVLIEILSAEYSDNKKHAARALGRCHPDEAKTLLPEVIELTQDNYARVGIAEMLYNLKACDDPRVITAMLEVLKKNQGSWGSSLSTGAMNVLGQAGGPLAVQGLTEAGEHSNPMQQMSAVAALGNIASQDTVAGLLDGLTMGVNVVCELAARGLSRVDDAALIEGLKINARSKYPKIRRKVARCLFYYSHDEKAVELVSELAANDKYESIRNAASLALVQLKRKQDFLA